MYRDKSRLSEESITVLLINESGPNAMAVHRLLWCLQVFVLGQTHLRNYTTITYYTDPRTWNEAYDVCRSTGGHLLDIISYSLFAFILDQSQESPWEDVPLGNGPSIWIGLHRKINLMGEEYYSTKCETLSEFKVVYWNSDQPYTAADGPESGFCVHDKILETRDGSIVTTSHDYTRAECSDNHPFFCQYESTEACQFELVPEHYGDTSNDYTADNDITLPFTTTGACADKCLHESIVYPHHSMKILEECWGYSITPDQCIIHIVVRPSYFLTVPTSQVYSTTSQLFLKKCFEESSQSDDFKKWSQQRFDGGIKKPRWNEWFLKPCCLGNSGKRCCKEGTVVDRAVVEREHSTVNSDLQGVAENEEKSPETGCGHLDIGESRLTFLKVTVFEGRYSWNDGLELCSDRNMEMLHIRSQTDYTALAQVVEKHSDKLYNTIWLGIHEPDPADKPNVRLWSNCEAESLTNWDDSYTDDVYDTNFCVVVDATSSFKWKQAPCNDQHSVICMGEMDSKPRYTNAQSAVTGDGVSLGPIQMNRTACKNYCSSKTYNDMDCWGYAHLTSTSDFCYLYFSSNSTFYEDHIATANSSVSFRRKMLWSDKLENDVALIPDVSIFPYSCCDVSDAISQCPTNNIPSHDVDIPTTRLTNFVLYMVGMTWNDAVTECTNSGGRLLQLDTLSKYHVAIRYINDWVENNLISSEIWIGLSQSNLVDPCSLRWTQDCNAPHWINFGNHPINDGDGKYCVAFGKDEMIKAACNEIRTFICEIDSGPCIMESSDDSNSYDMDTYATGNTWDISDDVFTQPETSSCNPDCLTAIHDGRECWATTEHGNGSCTLLFHTDPLYYEYSGTQNIQAIQSRKICFTSSVQVSAFQFFADLRLEPHNDCYVSFTLPFIRDEERCNEESSTLAIQMSSTDSMISSTTTVPDASSTISVASISRSYSPTASVISSTTSVPSISSSTSSLPGPLMLSPTIVSHSFSAATPSYISDVPIFISTSTASIEITPSYTSVSALPSQVVSTTAPPDNDTFALYKPIYLMPCFCRAGNTVAIDFKEWQEWLNKEHEVHTKNTSRYRRAVTCAWDSRPSSLGIGTVTISAFVVITVFVLVMDIANVVRAFNYIHSNRTS